jgi:NAD(P)-dependent dehydrogenase (short-subunit alcohol dehydrogenase family)
VLFAREGAKVLAADINLDAAVETKRIIEGEGGICEAVGGDVSHADDVATMADACIAMFGRIDVLHNNVGIVEVGGPVETTEESWDRVNDVNLKFGGGSSDFTRVVAFWWPLLATARRPSAVARVHGPARV